LRVHHHSSHWFFTRLSVLVLWFTPHPTHASYTPFTFFPQFWFPTHLLRLLVVLHTVPIHSPHVGSFSCPTHTHTHTQLGYENTHSLVPHRTHPRFTHRGLDCPHTPCHVYGSTYPGFGRVAGLGSLWFATHWFTWFGYCVALHTRGSYTPTHRFYTVPIWLGSELCHTTHYGFTTHTGYAHTTHHTHTTHTLVHAQRAHCTTHGLPRTHTRTVCGLRTTRALHGFLHTLVARVGWVALHARGLLLRTVAPHTHFGLHTYRKVISPLWFAHTRLLLPLVG